MTTIITTAAAAAATRPTPYVGYMLPGADVAVVHVGGDDAGDAGATTLAVQHDNIAGVLGEPRVHSLTEGTQAL